MKWLIFSLLLLCSPVKAIKVGKGRISIVDLGANITSKVSIAKKEFVNVYSLSANIDKSQKSILAIQGLIEQGATSLFVATDKGIKNIDIELDENSSETKSLNPYQNKIELVDRPIKLCQNSALKISSRYHINDYVLAGDPELLELDPFLDYYDEDFLKSFILKAKNQKAVTDIVVPTTHKIFKFTLMIDDFIGDYDNAIDLI